MKTLSVAGDRVVILLEGADTGQQYSVMEATVPPGGGPPPHRHHHEDETVRVLASQLTFYLGDKSFYLRIGQFISLRGIPNHFKNTGSCRLPL